MKPITTKTVRGDDGRDYTVHVVEGVAYATRGQAEFVANGGRLTLADMAAAAPHVRAFLERQGGDE